MNREFTETVQNFKDFLEGRGPDELLIEVPGNEPLLEDVVRIIALKTTGRISTSCSLGTGHFAGCKLDNCTCVCHTMPAENRAAA